MEVRDQRRERHQLERLVKKLRLDDREDGGEIGEIRALWRSTEHHRAHTILDDRTGLRLITSGWAGWVRPIEDGRRFIMLFLLPGDFISTTMMAVGDCEVMTLTPLRTVDAGSLLLRDADGTPVAPKAKALAGRSGTAYRMMLLDHLTRLGRGDTRRNVAHLLLEFHERLGETGDCDHDRFALPIGQRVIGQALGRSPVQINKSFAHLREEGLIEADNGVVGVCDAEHLRLYAAFRQRSAPRVPRPRGAAPPPAATGTAAADGGMS